MLRNTRSQHSIQYLYTYFTILKSFRIKKKKTRKTHKQPTIPNKPSTQFEAKTPALSNHKPPSYTSPKRSRKPPLPNKPFSSPLIRSTRSLPLPITPSPLSISVLTIIRAFYFEVSAPQALRGASKNLFDIYTTSARARVLFRRSLIGPPRARRNVYRRCTAYKMRWMRAKVSRAYNIVRKRESLGEALFCWSVSFFQNGYNWLSYIY